MTSLHTDILGRDDVGRLLDARDPSSVSIYLPTDPASKGDAERIELGNLAGEALAQLRDAGTDKREVLAIEDALSDLADDDDDEFWRFQARSLAVFATPSSLRTFRLANHLEALVEVSDRFHLKPLLRAVTFPQTAIVLALAQGSVRVLELVPGAEPFEVRLADMPTDVASAVGKSSIKDRSPSGRLQGTEGQKVRMRQFARQVDRAMGDLLHGRDVPLVLAAAEPLDAVYRSVNGYPHLAPTTIPGSPETTSITDLAAGARVVLDELYAAELAQLHELYQVRTSQDRTGTDLAGLARAATWGMVDTIFVDIDEVVPGLVDDDGAIHFADVDDAITYGVVDEIARRVWQNGGRVLAVRRDDIPEGGSAAAILRYAPLGSG